MEQLRERMVDRQIRARGIDDPRILAAFREVPRETFVPEELREPAYHDGALPIGAGQTISQPYVVAAMIAAAAIRPGDSVLEVGAGSGYAAAVIARLARRVHAIERHETLARAAAERIAALGCSNCTVMAGDGMKGLPEHAPFDAILVPASSDHVPEALKRQLALGGRLVIPLGNDTMQELTCITRTGEDSWERRTSGPVRFVPLLPGIVSG
ncbi:protein-L-isoaspartate(D-aspartate) O-methyltransferase [Erythrobacter sp. JK5]|nr:protein-L-isoaspartate(D-aspartate) O-methyltransferase [Erythrobacter sp. JK5]